MDFRINDHSFVAKCRQFLNSKMSIRQFCDNGYVNLSRSAFHNQIHSRLPNLDKKLYIKVNESLRSNWKNRHEFGSRGSK